MATAQDVIDTLKSIDASLKALVTHFGIGAKADTASQRPVPLIASDRDLDGQYGNPTVKAKSPRDWTGEDMKDRRFSECPAEYLDMVADRLDYFCATEEDPKKLRYQQLDAARARGWAQRIRHGYKPADNGGFPSDATATMVKDDDIAF